MTKSWVIILLLGAVTAFEDEFCKFKEVGNFIETSCSKFDDNHLPINHILGQEEHRSGFTIDLRKLEVSYSRVSTLQRDAFKLMPKLTQILLSNISLETIENGAFKGVTKLKYLDISENKLRVLPVDVFVKTQLRHLRLDGNPTLEKPTNGPIVFAPFIEWLSIRNCAIEHLPGAAFLGMPYLSHIDLSYNRLSQLPDSIFQNSTSLRFLDLSHNNFASINVPVFQNIPGYPGLPRTVLMSENPWRCDCNMAPIIIWLTADIENHFPTNQLSRTRLTKEAVCASPDKYAKIPWHQLDEWTCSV